MDDYWVSFGTDDTDIPSLEDAEEEIVTKQSCLLYLERLHKLTYRKDGSIKIDEEINSIEQADAAGRLDADTFMGILNDTLKR